jgi:heme o synthase
MAPPTLADLGPSCPSDPAVFEPGRAGADARRRTSALGPYWQLAKPGIVFGNLMSVAGGFFLASRGHVDGPRFAAVALGVSLVVASGCMFNNVIDRDIDARMERTRNRPLVRGQVSPSAALVCGALAGLAGLGLLGLGANLLSVLLALAGFAVYVGLYSLGLKRRSVHGTLVGSLAGAAPPVIGYCAVTNRFDVGAVLLLLLFSLWQMPHSYAIAIFRFDDYAAAGIPVRPVRMGIASAKRHILYYVLAFTLAAGMLTVAGYTGYAYLAVAVPSGVYWILMALSGRHAVDDRVWARRVFLYSLFAITSLSVMMAVDFATSAPPHAALGSLLSLS